MATREQIEANRRNAKLSKGPRNTDRSRFNGLKHGLCAAQVGLPGEDPAEVQAEFDGWRGDWQPLTHTRAVLVDLAAVATWRLRRSIRAGSAVRARLADDAGRAFDSERLAAVERAPSTASTTTPAPPSPCSGPPPPASTACSPPGASWTPPSRTGRPAGTSGSTCG